MSSNTPEFRWISSPSELLVDPADREALEAVLLKGEVEFYRQRPEEDPTNPRQ